METWELNGLTLEYDDDTHTYLVDGVIVSSVTQVLSVKFGKKYDHVDAETLKRACNYGTAVHKTIENYCGSVYDTDRCVSAKRAKQG